MPPSLSSSLDIRTTIKWVEVSQQSETDLQRLYYSTPI